MLRQRVLTALVLLAILLPAIWAPVAWPFAAVSLVFVAAAGWEWARLNGSTGAAAWALGATVLLAGIATAVGWPQVQGAVGGWLWPVATLAWVAGGCWVLARGIAHWRELPPALRLLLGAAMLWLAWLAIMQSKLMGLNFLLSVFCLAWAADIAAYFGGRAFGRRKLAPSISPGKSWEGVWAGMLGTLVLAVGWVLADRALDPALPSFYTLLVARWGWAGLAVVPALTAMTVVGDLFESAVKRVAGAKDSSNLLPGHGGVLDRIDALLPLFPLAWACVVVGHA